jgi:hypothetical protein
MTYTHNPIGFVVLSSINPDHDIQHWKHARPHAMTFTQNTFHLVQRCLDEIPELQVVILRTVLSGNGEKELHLSGALGAENMVNAFIQLCEYEGLDRERCYLQLWNEPDMSVYRDEKISWTVYAMRLARERGARVSALGVGMATLSQGDWMSGELDLLLNECADGYHILNIHSYGGPVLWAGAAGKLPDTYLNKDLAQQVNAPSPYDVQIGSRKGNWHIGRVFDVFQRCDVLGIPHPRVIVGECGIDRMTDLEWVELSSGQWVNIYDTLEKRYVRQEIHNGETLTLKVPWPHWGMRGWQTVRWVHEDYYPDWSPEQAYIEMLKWQVWMYDNLTLGEKPYVEAIQVFAHCPGMIDWDIAHGFDISSSDLFYAHVAAYGDGILHPPIPEPPPSDTPSAPSWLLYVLLFVCACIVGVVVYSIIAPRLAAQEVYTMEIIPISEAGNILLAAIGAILAGGLASPVTSPVVNFLKFALKLVGQEKLVSGDGLSLLVAAVVSIAIWLSRHFGVELQAANVMDWLAVALPIVLSGLSMFLSQKGMYTLSQRYEIPLFGYQRSK